MTRRRTPFSNQNNHTHSRPSPRGTSQHQGAASIERPFLYDAYGQFTRSGDERLWGNMDDADGWDYQFQGLPFDPEAMNEFRNRAMHPGVMPWMEQRDPASYVDGLVHSVERQPSKPHRAGVSVSGSGNIMASGLVGGRSMQLESLRRQSWPTPQQ